MDGTKTDTKKRRTNADANRTATIHWNNPSTTNIARWITSEEKATWRTSGNERTSSMYSGKPPEKNNPADAQTRRTYSSTQALPSITPTLLDANPDQNNNGDNSKLPYMPKEDALFRTQPESTKGDPLCQQINRTNGNPLS